MTWRKNKTKPVVHFGACSDVGRVRAENEDACGRFPREDPGAEEQLFIVADGMGGHERGREASTTAVEVVQRTYFAQAGGGGPVLRRLERAVQRANAQVHEQAANGRVKMGTTCTALALAEGRLFLAHVGDSRAYRIRNAHLEPLTQDHTLAEDLRREHVLTDDEARTHPRRHVLTRALGIDPILQVDLREGGAGRAGDRFLLCTDGLAEVPEGELLNAVKSHPPQQACEALVQQANERGGRDNVTVLIVAFA